MTTGRRLELLIGGPARPLDLTVREADTLADALSMYMAQVREWQKTDTADEVDASPEQIAQWDSERLAALHDLHQRLREHAGFNRQRPAGRS